MLPSVKGLLTPRSETRHGSTIMKLTLALFAAQVARRPAPPASSRAQDETAILANDPGLAFQKKPA